jgi:hypothetical protein
MKHLIITIMLLSNISLFGQVRNFNDIPKDILEELNKMGVDNSSIMNRYESSYLNVIFAKYRGNFDFTNKKVGFILRGAVSDKKEYFEKERDRYSRGETPNSGQLYVFDVGQKAESGGYDAASTYGNKFVIPIETVVKRLKEKR